MAKRITGSFYDINGEEFRVDIYDTAHGGAATSVDVTTLSISYDSTDNDDITSPIVASRAKVGIAIPTTDATLEAFVEDFATSTTERFFMEVLKVTGSVVVWRGVCLGDFSGEEDTAPNYIFTMSAMCGLGVLKKKPYHDGAAIYEGTDRLIEHLTTALTKLPHTSTFWGASDIFIKTAVDWWAVSMTATSTSDPLFQGGVDHAAFYDYKTTEGGVDKDVLSCYDVLWHILKTFECRIYMVDGSWFVEQIAYRTNATFYARAYSKAAGYLSFETVTGTKLLTQTLTGTKVSKINFDYLPHFSQAQVKYDVKTRRNYLSGANLSNTSTIINFNQDIKSTGGTSICRIVGNFSYKITNTAAAVNWDFIIPKFKLQVGSYYLSRPYDITNFSSNQGACTWSGDSGSRVHIPIGPFNMPTVGDFISGSFKFDMLTPPILGDGSTNQLTFYVDEIRTWQGVLVASGYTVTWTVNDLFLEIYDNGTPSITEDQLLYTCNGNNGSEKYETNIRLGTGSTINSAGRVQRWDGAAWVEATDWGQGVDARTEDLGDLLARNILNARDSTRRRLNGTLFGDFTPIQLIKTADLKKWMFTNMTWNIGLNTLNGSWLELEYGNSGVNSTPIKVKIIHNGPVFPGSVDPNNPTGTNTGGQGLNVNPSPTVLAPVSYNALGVAIEVGDTITSIPIKTASAGSEFLAGDSVGLVNPITGQFQYFEIATAPVFGATSLSVTSEVSIYDFPEDSYLVISQKPYAFSLPTGSTGDYLYFNGTEWVSAPFDEDAQDAIGAALVDTQTINFTYTDATPEIKADAITQMSITADASGLKLSGDSAAPGNSKLYGTDGSGAKGWYAQPTSALMPDGDYGDVTVSGTGTVINIDAGVVGTTELANDAVTFAKMQNIGTDKILGRDTAASGDVEEISLNSTLEFDGSLNLRRAALTGDVTATAGSNTTAIANDAVTDAKLRNSAALSVIGRSANSVGDPADIAAANDAEVLRRSGTTIGFGTVATAGIANDAVTYAKIQNVVADDVFLGRISGANGNVEELTATNAYSILGMTGQANRFAVWTGANTLTHNPAFTYLVDRMTITGTVAGGGAGNALLNINTGALGGTEFLRLSGTIAGSLSSTIINARNVAGTDHAYLQIASGGSSAGDALLQFTVSGQMTHAIGIDNSDGDRFKITPNATAPGANANMGICVRDNAGVGNTGINKDFPSHPLDGLGRAAFELWQGGAGNQWTFGANVAYGAGAGTGPSGTTIVGHGNAVRLNFSTGTTPTADGDVLILGYPFTFTTTSIVTFSARNSDATQPDFYISAESNTGCTLKVRGTLTASTAYHINFHIWGY